MSSSLAPAQFVILDGGMGTTLEDSGHNVSSHLWSSDPALRGAVADVHSGFLKAGAEMIGTATYQACEPLYTAHDAMSSEEAIQLMRNQVKVAAGSVETHASRSQSAGKQRIGLCLGPYGATLQPGQEYTGNYPAPFGPKVPFASELSAEEAEQSIAALRDFHLTRLLTYAKDEETWRSIDWICFETIPLLREALAIRMAFRALFQDLAITYGQSSSSGSWWRKKIWLGFVFPKGSYPDGSTVNDVVETALLTDAANKYGLKSTEDLLVPDAIGINCTSPAFIDSLGQEFTESCKRIQMSSTGIVYSNIAFVLYPDGGLVYDTITRTWSPCSPGGKAVSPQSNWAENVADVAKNLGNSTCHSADGKETRVWNGGVYVGGCCKSGFTEIQGLAQVLKGASA